MSSSTATFDINKEPAEYAEAEVTKIRKAYEKKDQETLTGFFISTVKGDCNPCCLIYACCASLTCCAMLCIPIAKYKLCRNISPEEAKTLEKLSRQLNSIATHKIDLPKGEEKSNFASSVLLFPPKDKRLLEEFSEFPSYPKDTTEDVIPFRQFSLWDKITYRDAKGVIKKALNNLQHKPPINPINIAALQQEAKTKPIEKVEGTTTQQETKRESADHKVQVRHEAIIKEKATRTVVTIHNILSFSSTPLKASKVELEELRNTIASAHGIDIAATAARYQSLDIESGTRYTRLENRRR